MELSKNYIPGPVEEKWYTHWQSKGYFKSVPDQRPAFTVVIPPPNVTGVLHMGHTLNETVQDILVRKARMSGFNACWVPGSDHASIATEAKVVEMLQREKGIEKKDLSREEFLKYAYEWKEKYGGIIYSQIARLGCSVDWDRVSFTMDDHYYEAVIKVFVNLYRKGLIYRGARMINWDPVAKTALSDEEVEYRDVTGKLYYLKYEVVNPEGSGAGAGHPDYILIATQRPETIMGDTAICAHPDDPRYAFLKGRKVRVPLIDREVPVIFDPYVDREFGTGVLKITPAHDINDFNLGLKYNLPVIDVLTEEGTISEAGQIYVGVDRFEARKQIVRELAEKGLLEKEESYATRLGYSQRTHSVAEPKISTQWFVKMKELVKPALEAVTTGTIRIHPGDKFTATYKYWLENVKDWCISRQLWWGQQIPAWYDEEGNVYVGESEKEVQEIYSREQKESDGNSSETNGSAPLLRRDEDVLDTWFSSWLWPIEVFRGITHPSNEELKYYYPTSVLVTGQDIIFFWVARMIMAGYEFENKKPFSDVYFTGMVRDKQGRKMSKSLGNSPDLLTLIHEYGADAVRFGIMISSPAGNDLLFDEASLEQGKFFNNKMWNALKLIRMWAAQPREGQGAPDSSQNQFAVNWFASRLNEVAREVNTLMAQFRLSEALKTLYSLIWDDFCSWYLEWIKPGFEQPLDEDTYESTISYFTQLLQMLHPFMPFITEEIYHLLSEKADDLAIRQFFEPGEADPGILEGGARLKELITGVRDARNKHQLRQKDLITLYIETDDPDSYRSFESILSKQISAEHIHFGEKPEQARITIVSGKDKICIEANVEVDAKAQKDKLLKDLAHLKGFLNTVNKKLTNDRFVQNAKPEVIELERKKKSDTEAKIAAIEQSLASLS